MRRYAIYSASESRKEGEPMYWSNKHGWVPLDQADTYTENETSQFNSAVGGRWIELKNENPLWEDNYVQFTRLLAEIMATGCLTEEVWDTLLDEMDLESDDLSELFERAQEEWERMKLKHCPISS